MLTRSAAGGGILRAQTGILAGRCECCAGQSPGPCDSGFDLNTPAIVTLQGVTARTGGSGINTVQCGFRSAYIHGAPAFSIVCNRISGQWQGLVCSSKISELASTVFPAPLAPNPNIWSTLWQIDVAISASIITVSTTFVGGTVAGFEACRGPSSLVVSPGCGAQGYATLARTVFPCQPNVRVYSGPQRWFYRETHPTGLSCAGGVSENTCNTPYTPTIPGPFGGYGDFGCFPFCGGTVSVSFGNGVMDDGGI